MKTNIVPHPKYHTKVEPVILRSKRSPTKQVQYLAIPINSDHSVFINTFKELPKELVDSLIDEKLISNLEEISTVIFCGKTNDFKNFEDYVYQFPQRRRDMIDNKPKTFRNYTLSYVEQKERMWLVSWCDSPAKSWGTVSLKVGDYCLLIKIIKLL